jgi:two-component system response regulator GlrR
MTSYGNLKSAVEAMKQGAVDYISKPFDHDEMLLSIQRILREKNLLAQNQALKQEVARSYPTTGMIGSCAAMQEVFTRIRKVAPMATTVLIRGESGTGKELVARALHEQSPRAVNPMISVNCAAIPETLIESELFGHEKGAFTGAQNNRKGLVEAADGGTLFLDEIGELPIEAQARLLRLLQEKEIRRIGSTQAKRVDVRLVAATHRDLKKLVSENRFREDLYYRLNVVSLHLPALAERREDIPLLAGHFLATLAGKYGKTLHGFAPEAIKLLATAPWPGNVRQLYNVVEQVCALTTAPLISAGLVQRALRAPTGEVLAYAEAKTRFERDYLVGLLKLTDGNVADAARLADRNRTEFYRLLQKHELTPGLFRSTPPAE